MQQEQGIREMYVKPAPLRRLKLVSRGDYLRELLAAISAKKFEEKDDFKELMSVIFEDSGFNERMLADEMGYNMTSVRRWIAGSTTPHKSMWGNVIKWCVDSLEREISFIQSELNAYDERDSVFEVAASNGQISERA